MKKIIRHVRTPFGKIVKYIFVGFNLIMLFWLWAYWSEISPMLTQGDQYSQVGAGIGSFLGTGMILTVWVLGDIILGIPLMLTRGDLVEYSPEDLEEEKRIKKEKQKWTRPYIYAGLGLIAFFLIIGSL